MLGYDVLVVDGARLPRSRGLCPDRGPREDPDRDCLVARERRTDVC